MENISLSIMIIMKASLLEKEIRGEDRKREVEENSKEGESGGREEGGDEG